MSIMPTPGLCRPRRGSPCRATVQGWSGRHNPGAWLTLPLPIAGEGGQDVQAEEQGHHRSVGGAARAVCATVHVAAGRGWLLAKIDQEVPPDLDVHLICDNYSTHKSPVVKTWLAAHPRLQMHFTPTYSSWLNQVERLFAFVTEDLLQRSHHDSVQQLEADIRGWVKDWNTHPKPFIWTKSADEILQSLGRLLKRISGAGH